jgi:hypothetical protein
MLRGAVAGLSGDIGTDLAGRGEGALSAWIPAGCDELHPATDASRVSHTAPAALEDGKLLRAALRDHMTQPTELAWTERDRAGEG